MELLAPISRNIFIPVFDRTRGIHSNGLKTSLNRSQFYTADRLAADQWQAIQSMLHFAYDHNRFYHDRFKNMGAFPEDIKSFSDFAKFPILSKEEIRSNLEPLISDIFDKKHLIWKRTGGSTGEPLQLYWNKECQVLKEGLVRRHDSWAHFLQGEKRAALWGNVIPAKELKRKIFDAIAARTIYLDTLKMDDNTIVEFLDKIKHTKTKLLFGHGHSLFFLARFMLDKSIEAPELNGIISTAESLPPNERAIVEKVFGPIVFDRYGCEEMGLIASECEEHNGMHIASEGVYLEIVDENEGDPGKVVVTDLVNLGTPLIRYEIGDLADTKSGICSCGRTLPRLGRVHGRTSDILVTPEGKRISGISILDTFTIHIPGIRQVQIVQEQLDEIIFFIVKDINFSEETLEILGRSVPIYFGLSMKYRVEFVDKPRFTGRGKFQFSISRINADQRTNSTGDLG